MSFCHRCHFTDYQIAFRTCPHCDSFDVGSIPTPMLDAESSPHTYQRAVDIPRESTSYRLTKTIFDHVSGHGVPRGKILLLAGSPGSGKSYQARWLSQEYPHAFYLTYEENIETVKSKFHEEHGDQLSEGILLGQTPIDVHRFPGPFRMPLVLVIDSMQTADVEGREMGSIGSARRCLEVTHAARQIVNMSPDMTVVIIAHETKDNSVAGPATVAHMVDCVMHLSADVVDFTAHRTLEITKNRCGPSGRWPI